MKRLKKITVFLLGAALLLNACSTDSPSKAKLPEDKEAPEVVLTSPAPGENVFGDVKIIASINDNVKVTSVEFLVNGEIVSTLDAAPYEAVWDAREALEGQHYVQVKAYDAAGNMGESELVTIIVGENPAVAIVEPQDQEEVSGELIIKTEAYDKSGIAKIELYVDEEKINEDTAEPYEFSWNTASVSDGTHTLKAVATDSLGNQSTSPLITVKVKNVVEAPSVNITAPQNEALVSGSILISAAASAAEGKSIAKVEFFVGTAKVGEKTTVPYEIDWNSVSISDGSYSIKAVATDNEGVSATDNDTVVTVSNDLSAPVANVESPLNGATVSGSTIITASALDNKGVSKVEFFINGDKIGEDAIAPYECVWNTLEFGDGNYALMVKASDLAGNVGTDNDTTVIVDNSDKIAPLVDIFSPAHNGIYQEGDSVSILASASDNVGVTRVEFFINDQLLHTDDEAPYEASWTAATAGSYALKVKAYDAAGNAGTDDDTVISVQTPWTSPAKVDFQLIDDVNFKSNQTLKTNPTDADVDLIKNGTNPGDLRFYLYVPADMPAQRPVVMALHGCNHAGYKTDGGHAARFRKESEWTQLADRYKFYVVFPEVKFRDTQNETMGRNKYKVNGDFVCFAWAGFYGMNFERGAGEGQSLVNMVNWIKNNPNYSVDNSKVFITGLSAGAAMSVYMAATYPDVFAGASAAAGIAYNCANHDFVPQPDSKYKDDRIKQRLEWCMGTKEDFQPRTAVPSEGDDCDSGEACMSTKNAKFAPDILKGYVQAAYPGYSGKFPKMVIWQGGKDEYVDEDNKTELEKQWLAVHGLVSSSDKLYNPLPDETETIKGFTLNKWKKDGEVVVASMKLPNMKHGFPVDPCASGQKDPNTGLCNDVTQGGYDSGMHGGFNFWWGYDQDIWYAYYTAHVWGILDSVSHGPSLAITAPTQTSGLSSSFLISANASDASGIEKVEFFIDGVKQGEDLEAPYEYQASAIADGSHTIKVKATSLASKTAEKTLVVSVGGFICRHWTAANTVHVSEGRAVEFTQYYVKYAKTIGKGDDLGLHNQYITSDVKETAPGYFEKGKCN